LSQSDQTPEGRPDADRGRILDAAANRAAEALRVVEDYLRFVLDDRQLLEKCKHLRHQLTAVCRGPWLSGRWHLRHTPEDVGTDLTAGAESARRSSADVLAANLERLKQSLRSLEEWAKVDWPAEAARLEQLRYETYTLEKAVCITLDNSERLADARLYVLLDGRDTERQFVDLAGQLVDAGVDIVQLRDKRLPDRDLLRRARLLREITAGSGTLFVMNDRADLALLSDADGLHVGQEELSVKDARRLLGPQPLVGVSTHSIEQARQAVLDGASYLGAGPTFASPTKQFERFEGLEFLRQVAAEITRPVFAIGGITSQNVAEVLAAGIRRVAVSSAVVAADDPAAAARELQAALSSGGPGTGSTGAEVFTTRPQ